MPKGQRRTDSLCPADKAAAYLETTVDEAFLPQLPEHPPYALHVGGVHRAVAIVKVDPSAHAPHRLLPLLGVAACQHADRLWLKAYRLPA